MRLLLPLTLAAPLLAWTAPVPEGETAGVEPVDFVREVHPLLVDRCFACHGPDAGSRASELRLDSRAGATADLGGGRAAVVPGDAESSELWRRITSDSERKVMPPPEAHAPDFTGAELATLRRWIEEGAPWARHWAFERPQQVPLAADVDHPVDALVRGRLADRGWDLAPPASSRDLARRLRFDLTGLPPTPEEVERLGEGGWGPAWEVWIEELLASPAHAERLAMWWLDAARYADTDGFQIDEVRSNWPWRDWVVEAFRENLPFDRFTELQFAGDLLEDAGPEEVLATCFHRNHMHNGEGGRDPEESRVDYVRDRVNTVGAVWLGLTLECAQCHDHKFDPVSQADYYALSAFFDSIDESGRAGRSAGPFLAYRSPHAAEAQALAEAERAAAAEYLRGLQVEAEPAFEAWLEREHRASDPAYRAWRTLEPLEAESAVRGAELARVEAGVLERRGTAAVQDDYTIRFAPSGLSAISGIDVDVLVEPGGTPGAGPQGDFVLTGLRLHALRDGQRLGLAFAAAVATREDGQDEDKLGPARGLLDDDPRTGWRVAGSVEADAEPVHHRARLALEQGLELLPGDVLELRLHFRSQVERAYPERLRVRATQEGGAVARELGRSAHEELAAFAAGGDAVADLPESLRERLRAVFLEQDAAWRDARRRADRLEAQAEAARGAGGELQITVLRERSEARTTHVLERGEWDQKGAVVGRAFPAAVFERSLPASGEGWTRLDLAHWLTDPAHPLTARVVVNQIWQQLFGAGLVRTPADFGLQGQRPLYPELLDWLAVDFVASGWDLRHLIRTIVTSATYRQDSRVSPERLALDPANEWLARGARFRLPSWMLRDAALAVSGLLDARPGGPPVYPHQPPGVWEELFMGRFRYEPTVGRARHRRTLYAFWRRNAAPSFLFDNADRRSCAVDVRRTNTPLQALTLLNDRAYLEAASALARRALDEAPGVLGDQLDVLAARVLQRALREDERAALLQLHAAAESDLRADPRDALRLARPSDLDAVPAPVPEDALELAALSTVATVLLNLDEALTHE